MWLKQRRTTAKRGTAVIASRAWCDSLSCAENGDPRRTHKAIRHVATTAPKLSKTTRRRERSCAAACRADGPSSILGRSPSFQYEGSNHGGNVAVGKTPPNANTSGERMRSRV